MGRYPSKNGCLEGSRKTTHLGGDLLGVGWLERTLRQKTRNELEATRGTSRRWLRLRRRRFYEAVQREEAARALSGKGKAQVWLSFWNQQAVVGGAHHKGAQGRKCSHPSVPKLVSFECFSKFCSVIECQILNEILDQLAPKYPEVKFVRAVATKCVEGMLDRDLPALLFYKNEDLIGNIIPAREVLGGKRMT